MPALTLRKIEGEILITGAIYDQVDKLSKLKQLTSKYQLIIINGDICYPEGNIQERMNLISDLCQDSQIIYNLGKNDLLESKQNNSSWFNKPNVVIVEFVNQSGLIITNGGLTPPMNLDSLKDNLETTFVNYIDHKPWHESYYGFYGYVISNHPLTETQPEFYNHSLQLGSKYKINGNVFAQEVNQYGLKDTILL
jgi:hypothetical protein